MTRHPRRDRRSSCPISIGLELFGDAWSLLIVRDLMFRGVDSFGGFLQAEERIATNILTDRLARLEAAGIVDRRPDPDDARRSRWRLTRKGIELAPLLVDLVLWSARHEETGAPASVVAAMGADPAAFARGIMDAWERDRAVVDAAGAPATSDR